MKVVIIIRALMQVNRVSANIYQLFASPAQLIFLRKPAEDVDSAAEFAVGALDSKL